MGTNTTHISPPTDSPAPSAAFAAAASGRITAMSTRLSLVMTTFGFVVSAIFILFVLVRLLCARFQSRRFASGWAGGVATNVTGERHQSGMNPVVITLFPTIKFTKEVFASQEDNTCIVCLEEYEDHDFLRIMPQCGHAFHVNCIDAWLRRHTTCPVCRLHLQNTSSRRNMPSPLLTEAARARFSPGAIPEALFAHPLSNLAAQVQEHRQCVPFACDEDHVLQILDVKDVVLQVTEQTSAADSRREL